MTEGGGYRYHVHIVQNGNHAVMLGAPLYMFHLHKEALRFLSGHQKALTGGLPIAIFAGGPIEANEEKDWQKAWPRSFNQSRQHKENQR